MNQNDLIATAIRPWHDTLYQRIQGDMMVNIADIIGGGNGETFLNVPKSELNHLNDVDVVVLGVPCATPYQATGTYAAGAPRALRAAIAQDAHDTPHMNFDLGGPTLGNGQTQFADCGDLPWSAKDHTSNRATITEATRKILDADAIPIILGGDDSIPIPVYEAFFDQGPVSILQIDAHIDWRDEVDGERLGLSSNMRRASEMPHIESIVQVGARGIGSARPSDFHDAQKWGVKFIPAEQFMAQGIASVLPHIPEGRKLLINFDVDAMDPAIMPAVIGPAPGGLSYWQVVQLIREAIARTTLAAFSIVEFYPDNDPDGIAALTASRVVSNVLGALAQR